MLLSIPAWRCALNLSHPCPLGQGHPRTEAVRRCLEGQADPGDPFVLELWAKEGRDRHYLRTSLAPWVPSRGPKHEGPPSAGKNRTPTPGRIWIESAVTAARSIQRRGYRRQNGPDGDIAGVLLMTGAKWCVVITNGKHRATALSALGHTELPVRMFYNPRFVVRREDAEYWPQVADGDWTRSKAEQLFDSVMSEVTASGH